MAQVDAFLLENPESVLAAVHFFPEQEKVTACSEESANFVWLVEN